MTQAKIVDAAFKVWGRNFYQKTSLSQLAKVLGVSKPAFYRHFRNKQALNEAMTERFYDDLAASIGSVYDQAMQSKDSKEGILAIIRNMVAFYTRNVYAFIFSLTNLYNRGDGEHTTLSRLKSRGVNTEIFQKFIEDEYSEDKSMLLRLVFTTLSFFVAVFHKSEQSFDNPPTEEKIQRITEFICDIIECGLNYEIDGVNALDFEALEKLAVETVHSTENEPLFRAVAEAVAEAGPWGTSMEMVAQRLGLSKSSLYNHFKNRKDMLRRLFLGEFKRIMSFARQGISKSALPLEQLYLGIFPIAVYLRSRPEILVAMDWIRTRKLDLGKPEKQEEIFWLFKDVDIEHLRKCGEDERRNFSHWILFLLIHILKQRILNEDKRQSCVQNNDIRLLYRFVTLGLEGFKR